MVDFRGRLTEEQKKLNHIESERKRRESIRASFDALAQVVPDMQGQARSESVMLQATVAHLTKLIERKEELYEIATAKGMSEEQFNRIYDEFLLPNAKDAANEGRNDQPISPPSKATSSKPAGAKSAPGTISNKDTPVQAASKPAPKTSRTQANASKRASNGSGRPSSSPAIRLTNTASPSQMVASPSPLTGMYDSPTNRYATSTHGRVIAMGHNQYPPVMFDQFPGSSISPRPTPYSAGANYHGHGAIYPQLSNASSGHAAFPMNRPSITGDGTHLARNPGGPPNIFNGLFTDPSFSPGAGKHSGSKPGKKH